MSPVSTLRSDHSISITLKRPTFRRRGPPTWLWGTSTLSNRRVLEPKIRDSNRVSVVLNMVTVSPWPPPEVVWVIRSQSVLSVFLVHLHLNCHVVQCYLPTLWSPKKHFNARCERGLSFSLCPWISYHVAGVNRHKQRNTWTLVQQIPPLTVRPPHQVFPVKSGPPPDASWILDTSWTLDRLWSLDCSQTLDHRQTMDGLWTLNCSRVLDHSRTLAGLWSTASL